MKKVAIAVLLMLTGCAVGAGIAATILTKKIDKKSDFCSKMSEFYRVLVQWLIHKQEGKNLSEYFERNEYKTIAIYGMKELGERLYNELKDTNIKVAYAIDKEAKHIYADINMVTPNDKLERVDAIVVTAIHYYDEIEKVLRTKVDYPVISIEDVIYGV